MSRLFYPAIHPYHTDWLTTEDQQRLYFEQSGNAKGIPVLYLHGGPGAGSHKDFRRYFDPQKYRIIQFDQRGCGLSTPSPSLINNDVAHLLQDIEQLRQHLAIEQWLIAGGSWGSTLALLYGIAHAKHVLAFILRGIFLATDAEYAWLYHPTGVAKFFPEYYQEFTAPIDKVSSSESLTAYYELLTSENEIAATAASKAWYLWENRLSSLENYNLTDNTVEDTHQALCMAKISSHYFYHQCFIEPNFILNNINSIQHLPATVIHGRYDMVCQLHCANELVQLWPNAELQILPYAGHSGFERQTIDAFCKAADAMASFLTQEQS
jgi:proline iminopeptidase